MNISPNVIILSVGFQPILSFNTIYCMFNQNHKITFKCHDNVYKMTNKCALSCADLNQGDLLYWSSAPTAPPAIIHVTS